MSLATIIQDVAAVITNSQLTAQQKSDQIATIYAAAFDDQIKSLGSWTIVSSNGWTIAFTSYALTGRIVELFGVVAQKAGIFAPVDPHQQFTQWDPLHADPAGPITMNGQRFRLDPVQNAIDCIGNHAERMTS